MEGITNKRALVTGGSKGIGLDIAKKLAELGATVYIIARGQEALDKAVEESGNALKAIKLDVSDSEKVKEEISKILPIQLLVNNAGITFETPILESTGDDFDKIIGVNLKGAINLTQIVTKDLISREMKGNVVNISSLAGIRVNHTRIFYNVSKAGLDMATKCFAVELGAKNIRVNSVSMGIVKTELGESNWIQNPKRAAMVQQYLQRTSNHRFVEHKEITDTVVFLLSSKASMINGHIIRIDGGLSLT